MEDKKERFSFIWWGCASVEISLGELSLVIDPYIKPDIPIYDYIFCTQEHYDHYHPGTLSNLCKGNNFKKIVVNPGCVSPARLIKEIYSREPLSVYNWEPASNFVPSDKLQILYPKYRQDESKIFPEPSEIKLGRLIVKGVESGETPTPDVPSVGFLIKDTISGLSFYHTGDLWEPYPELEKLKGEVDFLFHMKTGWDTNINKRKSDENKMKSDVLRLFVEYVRPRYLVPTHYRPADTQLYPISRDYSFGETTDTRCRKGWVPDISDPAAYTEEIRDIVGDITRVINVTAGRLYEIEMPSKKINWRWKFI